jgi:V/A-type H+/Na+-transporting ATPase subunit K
MKPSIGYLVAFVGALSVLSTLLLFAAPAQGAEAVPAAAIDPVLARWAFLAAAGATGVSSIAAAFAVARVGSAAVGALAEKPELFGRVLVLVGLAEGIAIYGLIVSILILNRLG